MLKTAVVTDQWMQASWEDFLQLTDDYDYQRCKFYYFAGWMKIEIASVGNEKLGIQEYWVVNVTTTHIRGFSITDEISQQIRESQVLLGLSISLVEEALKRSK
jgi:Uma2 family endonuclease